jgi:two-component system phosphate regulon sensor histidine kinase PhoR
MRSSRLLPIPEAALRGDGQARPWDRLVGAFLGRKAQATSQAPPTPSAALPEASPARLFAEAVEAMPDAVLIVSGETTLGIAGLQVIASNAAARELLRMRQGGDDRLVSILRHPEILEAAEHTLQQGVPHTLAYEAGGAPARYWRVWTRRLPPEAGRRYVLLVLRDETNARRHERMRVDFLANASHELRTPLASLAGFIETLRGHAKEDPAARDRFLGIMSAQAQRMGRLIDDLLSLSRIELNEHVPPSGVCDVGQIAREVVDGLTPVVSAKQVELELTAPEPGEAAATGDRDQISQVVQNLVDNAVKYSPTGGRVRVEVAAEASFDTAATGPRPAALQDAGGGRLALLSPDRAHAQRYVMVRVTDHGAGMAREHLPRLTERFYRVPGQKSGDTSGTGLGLAIVKHVINRHRGGLLVESAPGQGTIFTVYLPLANDEQPQAGGVTKAW